LKITYYALAAMMCLNAFVLIMHSWGITPVPLTAFNTTHSDVALNATEILESWDWSEKEFYDIGSGIGFLWTRNVPIIESALGFMANIGTPTQIIEPLRYIWRFFWVGFLLSFISGRDFMP